MSKRLKVILTVISFASILSAGMAAPAEAIPADRIQTFANAVTNRCLDDSFEYGFRPFTCNGTDYQRWIVNVWDDGTKRFMNVFTARCFDDSGWPSVDPCNSSQIERWYVRSASAGIAFQNQSTGKCLDDSEFGLRLLPCTYNTYQSWG